MLKNQLRQTTTNIMLASRTLTRKPARNKQRGAALMVMLIVVVIGSLAFLVSSLGKADKKIERDKITTAALAQAKEALIGYAINSENSSTENKPRPGNLPCPDIDAPDPTNLLYGVEEGACVAGAIGRLPWKSLGIPELVDDAGEPLWYAVSGNFRRESMNSNSIINSDAQGTLLVYATDGTTLLTPAGSEAIAIIFSPGAIVGNHQRNSVAQKIDASNYLETGSNGRNNSATNGPFIAGDKTSSFNDRLLYITTDQLLPSIEKRVAHELKNHLKSYYDSWKGYPFAATFSDPSSATFTGVSSLTYGLYPFGGINGIGDQPTSPAWNAIPSISYAPPPSGSGILVCSLATGGWVNSRSRCCSNNNCNGSSNIVIPTGTKITITGKLNNVGLGFWKLHDIRDIAQVRARDSNGNNVLASSVLDNVSVTGSLDFTNGSATVIFSGTGRSGGSTLQRIEFRDIQYQSSPLPSWFAMNNWNELIYYTISSGYAPGGGNTCIFPGTPSCLKINGNGGINNSRAAIIMSGRAIAGSHSSATLSNYLEAENLTPADYIFENKTRSATFNDQVISVAP